MSQYSIILLLILSFTGPLQSKDFIVLGCREPAGMFSIFHDVLALLKCYDAGYYSGIEVDFGTQGVYYDPNRSENWWNYYCEPIFLGKKDSILHVLGDPPFSVPYQSDRHTTRLEACALIEKYLQVKPFILEKVAAFEQKYFKDQYVITVHYRGTDKVTEAPFVRYEKVTKEIMRAARERSNYRIFVATDEKRFLDYLVSIFGSKVVFQEALRSSHGDPLHLSDRFDHYQCGLEAMVDCLLLSKGDILIRTSSNLSKWSTFFNPYIPVVLLN